MNELEKALEALDNIEQNEDKEYWRQDSMSGNIETIRTFLQSHIHISKDELEGMRPEPSYPDHESDYEQGYNAAIIHAVIAKGQG